MASGEHSSQRMVPGFLAAALALVLLPSLQHPSLPRPLDPIFENKEEPVVVAMAMVCAKYNITHDEIAGYSIGDDQDDET
ncbi:hypothetical protein C2845_PM07G08380 [Panicum miliaceum]|uniref:Uncharacterized protein n=1 Tax=Panicum miliaceum TaxID=4540 RepID=A0A3L6SLG2_PANMI|nr:hypothetical protein C2845_PM07G08380 [Panicum miliaceum]